MKPALCLLFVLAAALTLWLRAPAREPIRRAEAPVGAEPEDARIDPPPASTSRSSLDGRVALAPDDSASTRTIAIEVQTISSYGHAGRPIPRVAFEIRAQAPVARDGPADLPFAFPMDPGSPVLARGRTDEQGNARVELEAAGVRSTPAGIPLICGQVAEPGHQRTAAVSVSADGAHRIRLVVRAGATARGRVVDPAGAPVTGPASVRLRRWRGDGRLDTGAGARHLANGWFELDLREPIVDGVLVADVRGRGTGATRGVSIALDAPSQDLRVVVDGAGALRARVVDRTGAPAAGVELSILLAELDDGTGAGPAEPLASRRAAEGGGQLWRTLSTDAQGRVELLGLRHAAYTVRARLAGEERFEQVLTPQPALADGIELALEMSRSHLLVRLLDEHGAPLATPAEERMAGGERGDGARVAWPTVPYAVVLDCAADPSDPCVAGAHRKPRRLSLAETVWEAPAGRHYLVAARGGGFDGAPRRVELPEGSERVEVELRQRPRELAALAVTVSSSAGTPAGNVELRLESVDGALPVVEKEWSDGGPLRFEVPPGAYRVVAEGRPHRNFFHGTVMLPRSHGRAEAAIELRPGATRAVTLVLAPGARLAVRLTGAANAADRAAVRVDDPWIEPDDLAAAHERRAASATLFLAARGRAPEPVVHIGKAYHGTTAYGDHLLEAWPLGEARTSEALPAGHHTLVARLPGGREARAEVELVAGETLAVELAFLDAPR